MHRIVCQAKNYPTHHIPHLAGHSIDIIVNRAAIVVSGTRYAMPAPMKVLMVLCNVYTFMGSGTRMPLICTLILNDFFSYKPVCHNIVYPELFTAMR